MKKFKNILVLAAMAEEEAAIRSLLADNYVGGRSFGKHLQIHAHDFRVGDIEIIVAQSGIGKVNAALAVNTIVENQPLERKIDAVILLGVGGSIVSGLEIGDLVLSTAVLQHDYFGSLEFGDVRMLPGDLILRREETVGYQATMAADQDLVEMIAKSVFELPVHKGVVVSGCEFAGTVARKRALHALCDGALLVEMEAAGVAQICRKLNLPFVVVKTVADRLNPDDSIETDFVSCLQLAARNAAIVLKDFLAIDQ